MQLIIILTITILSYLLLDYLIKDVRKNPSLIYVQKIAIVCNILMCLFLTCLCAIKILELM
jgi:uncharacterized protein with PQ loop repeat